MQESSCRFVKYACGERHAARMGSMLKRLNFCVFGSLMREWKMDAKVVRQDLYENDQIISGCKGRKSIYKAGKRCFDVIISLLALIIFSPVFLITAIAIKIEDHGPVIHKRYCVGKGNSTYVMYKFRSMKVNADYLEKMFTQEQLEEYKKECKLENDPRITKVGKIIRRFSIDELPQLITVLQGNMSLIGPRPIVDLEAEYYGDDLDAVLNVTPGLTGYWQVNGRSDATYESGRRQELELFYVRNQSVKLDIEIFFKTIITVLGGRGAR